MLQNFDLRKYMRRCYWLSGFTICHSINICNSLIDHFAHCKNDKLKSTLWLLCIASNVSRNPNERVTIFRTQTKPQQRGLVLRTGWCNHLRARSSYCYKIRNALTCYKFSLADSSSEQERNPPHNALMLNGFPSCAPGQSSPTTHSLNALCCTTQPQPGVDHATKKTWFMLQHKEQANDWGKGIGKKQLFVRDRSCSRVPSLQKLSGWVQSVGVVRYVECSSSAF